MSDQSLLTESITENKDQILEEKPSSEILSQSSPSSESSLDTLLDSIKNEKGERKYKDIPTALEALSHSQAYIEKLKSEKEETSSLLISAQSQLEKSAKMDEFLDQLKSSQEQQPEETSPPAVQGLTTEDVEKILVSREQKKIASENVERVREHLLKNFGQDANTKVQEAAQSFGMTVEDLTQLSAKSPEAVLRILGGATLQQKSTTSSINTAAIPPAEQPSGYPKATKSLMNGASQQEAVDFMKSLRSEAERRILG